LNAIVHKDYATGNPIHIHVYPDKVLIYNDGRLPDRWTVDNLFVPHTSKPYNPLIAGAFFRSGQIEAWGRGVQKIADARRLWGQAEPFYRVSPNEVMIGFDVDSVGIVGNALGSKLGGEDFGINGESVGVSEESVGVNGENIGINGKSVGVNDENIGINGKSIGINDENIGINQKSVGVNEKSVGVNRKSVGVNGKSVGVKEAQQQILSFMIQNPEITAVQIAEIIGITKRRVESNIRRLKVLGLIERVGADKNGYWVVKSQS